MNNKRKHSLLLKLKNTNTVLISLISAILIIIIDYINPTDLLPYSLMMAIGFICVLMILWFMYSTNFWKLIKLQTINPIDFILFSIDITLIIYGLYLFCIKQLSTWKFKTAVVIFSIVLISEFFREICIHPFSDKTKRNKDKNIIDLRELYKGKIKSNTQPIIISDKAVNYDLLDRSVIVSLLNDAINDAYSSNAYVIGLEGEWGTGKTTIANLVQQRLRNNEDIKIVKDFNFWTAGSQTAILNSMYDSLLKAIGVDYKSTRMKRLLRRTANFVTTMPKMGKVLGQIIDEDITQNDVNQLKDKLEELILSSGKRYVFFVDDLDRADNLQVLFLLKMLGTLFNLPNLIFVLLYDKKRMNAIVDNGEDLNAAFAEKIINQEIRVPEVSEQVMQNIYKTGLSKLAIAYGVGNSEIQEIKPAIDLIVEQIKSIRDLKRIMNSACAIAFDKNNYLNRRDLLLLEFIHFKEPNLYKLIYDNSGYFISQDFTSFPSGMPWRWDKDNTEKIKKFYNENLSNYSKYLSILEMLFPYVKNYYNPGIYNSDQIIIQDMTGDNERRRQLRVCSDYYFNLYFSLTQNDYSKINVQVRNIVQEINEATTVKEITKSYNQLLTWDDDSLYLGIEDFRMYVDEINKDKRLFVARLILNSANGFSDRGMLSLRSELLIACSLLLERSEINKVSKMLQHFSKRYKLIGCLNALNNYVKDYGELQKVVMKSWYKVGANILNNKIDLYSNKNYEANNAWGFFNYVKQKRLPSKTIRNYLDSIISNKNVYRVLFDAITESTGTGGYGYRVEKDNYETMGLANISKIEDFLKNKKQINESKRRVLSVYQRFLKNDDNEREYYNNPINPNEL